MVPLRISRVYVRTFHERAQAKDEVMTQRTPVTKRRRAEALRREERDTENEGSKHSEEKSRSTQRRRAEALRGERNKVLGREEPKYSEEKSRSTQRRGVGLRFNITPSHTPAALARMSSTGDHGPRVTGFIDSRFRDSRFSSTRRFVDSRFAFCVFRWSAAARFRRFVDSRFAFFEGGENTSPVLPPFSPPFSPLPSTRKL